MYWRVLIAEYPRSIVGCLLLPHTHPCPAPLPLSGPGHLLLLHTPPLLVHVLRLVLAPVADRHPGDRRGSRGGGGEGCAFPGEAHEEPAQHRVLVGVRRGWRYGPFPTGGCGM